MTVKQSIGDISIEGVHLLLSKIYSEIGFDEVCGDLPQQINNPTNGQAFKKTLLLNDEQKYLAKLFDF